MCDRRTWLDDNILVTKRGIASRKRRFLALGLTLLSLSCVGLFSVAFASWNFDEAGAARPAVISGIDANVGTVVDFSGTSYLRLTASSVSAFNEQYGFVQPDGSFGNSGSVAALFYVNGSGISDKLGGSQFGIKVTGGFGNNSFALSGSYDYAFGAGNISEIASAEPSRVDGSIKTPGSDGSVTTDLLSVTDMTTISWLCVWFDFSVPDSSAWPTLESDIKAAGFRLNVLLEARS